MLVYGVGALVVNTVVDVALAVIDPRWDPRRGRGTMKALRRAFRNPLGAGAIVTLVLVVVVAIAAPIIWGAAAGGVDTTHINAGPGPGHPIGTDSLGRDLLLRTLVAARLTLLLALGRPPSPSPSASCSALRHSWLGRAGRAVIAGVNIAVAFPGVLLALCLATVLGVGASSAMIAIGVAGAPSFARFCQTLVASVSERDYIAAARLAGVGRVGILGRHVLPNIAEPLIVNATIGAGGALLAFAEPVVPRSRRPASRLRLGAADDGGTRPAST